MLFESRVSRTKLVNTDLKELQGARLARVDYPDRAGYDSGMSTLPPNASNAAMGATPVPGGVVFRTWAPRAKEVRVIGDFSGWLPNETGRLQPVGDGTWAGDIAGLGVNTAY